MGTALVLHHTLYLSSAREDFDAAAIARLAAAAARRNRDSGISGMLLYADGNFLQYIEGTQPAVAELLQRIRQDPRHSGLLVVSDGPIQKRRFEDWHMGVHVLDQAKPEHEMIFDLTRATLNDAMPPELPAVVTSFMRNFYTVNAA